MPVVINGTTGISGLDGSSGTPSFRGSDADTGIFFGTDVVLASTAGVERWRTDSGGQFLLGGTLPGSPAIILSPSGRIKGLNFYTGQFDFQGGGTQTIFTPVRGATYIVCSQMVNYTIPSTDTRHGVVSIVSRTAYGTDETRIAQLCNLTGVGGFAVSGVSVTYQGGGGNPQTFITWFEISHQY